MYILAVIDQSWIIFYFYFLYFRELNCENMAEDTGLRYKDEYRQEIKRSLCNGVFLLATNILLEPTDSTLIIIWVQKLKILATFKHLHLTERNKIVCTHEFHWCDTFYNKPCFTDRIISSQDTENIWLGRNDRTWLVGKRNEKSCILGISLY